MPAFSKSSFSAVRAGMMSVGLTLACAACSASADAASTRSTDATRASKPSLVGAQSARQHDAVVTAADTTAGARPRNVPASDVRGVRPSPAEGPDRFLARWDADGDGRVALAELPVWLQSRKKPADTNAHGVLTREEIQADCAARQSTMRSGGGTAAPGSRHAARFAASDVDGDGALTEQEVGSSRWARLRAADRNGDGKVTREEADQALVDGTLTPRGGGSGRWAR